MTVKREQVLIEALPYIREFYDSIMVFKIGGSIMSDTAVLEDFIQDVVLLRYISINVHRSWGRRYPGQEKFVRRRVRGRPGYRSGDRIARMVLLGHQCRACQPHRQTWGQGIGLSGPDGMFLKAKKKALQMVEGKKPQDQDLWETWRRWTLRS